MTSELVSESASTTVRRLEKGSYEFVVKEYSLHRGIGVHKAIESEKFMVVGHSWTIRFYPDGEGVDAFKAGDASLYISLKSDSTVWCFREFYIVDQSGKGNHFCRKPGENNEQPFSCLVGSCMMSGYLHFIDKAYLESYVKDDCVIISVKIGVFNSHIQMLPLIKVPPSCNIGTDLGKLLEGKRGQPGDVFFKIATDGESIGAHKSVLAIRSPVFRSLLSNDHAHRPPHEIVIRDVESRVFKMLAVANQYKLKRLKELCESCLMYRISEKSVTYLLHLAYAYHATQLEAACLKFQAQTQLDGCETCPLLFPELAHNHKEKPSTSHDKGHAYISKIFKHLNEANTSSVTNFFD
ncbi:hypothetical protein CDL12_23254 [Handroanthus impetiginosus]|uniref:Speckle-type POZ protein SPOP n=1 Tax=Handroanthus impetiginosus TaxID=429701 RepID=A0A2G9GG92_9LAMI|nr:hypothetical protein CDL12_23254 [Handroanthus impetiginosus]